MLFIYFWSSLIFFKKYALNPNKSSNLWWGILFTNFAIYTKESTILIYFGILLYSFLYNLWNEKIKLSSFIHPLKTMRQMPLEMLLFISMLIYAWFYLQNVYAILDSPYLGRRSTTIFYAAKLYIFEIIVVLCAVYYALKNLYKHNLCFLPAGLILGALSFMIMIVVYLRLNTFSSQLYSKTYYVVLAYMICLFYLLFSVSDWKRWLAICCIICATTLFFDYNLAKREEGKSYREVAEFLISQKTEPLNIFISEKSEPFPWWYGCWASVYKYYWPKKRVFFWTPYLNPKDQESAVFSLRINSQPKIYHPIHYKEKPTANDFYVIKKTEDFKSDKRLIDDILHQKVFENKLFEVYKIK
ncbi:MAG: hypothetical protein IJ830_00935 [Alphaproteobacteria bacterium]|nr:hypothetical protein [Alphaproteobacteria bacterium]